MACQKEDQELDRISHLPDLLTDKILSLLPIRDAVRTSVFSTNWRFKWTTLSKLVFDDNCTVFRGNGKSICTTLINIIDSVLLLHSGAPIEKFMLSHKHYKVTADIDRWILHLSKASLHNFILHIHKGPYKVPSCLFSCQSLSSLELFNCSINYLPPTFRGFKNLKSLCLFCVPVSKQVLEDLISGSCLLENLTLLCYNFENLTIDASKLQYLSFKGVIQGISLSNTFSTKSFYMEFYEDKEDYPDAPTGYINLPEFFDPLRNVETLTLDGHIIKYLSIQEVPAVLEQPFLSLQTLVIKGVHFSNVKEILVILCLLQSASNLEEVEFSAPKEGDKSIEQHIVGKDDCSGDEIYESANIFTFAHLKYAWLIGIHHDSALEMGFAGILLTRSPALQKMTIKVAHLSTLYPKGSGKYKMLKHMLHLLCASPEVELVFVDASHPY